MMFVFCLLACLRRGSAGKQQECCCASGARTLVDVAMQDVEILEGTKVDVKARVVTVTGKRGTLTRDFKHLNIEIKKGKNKKGKDAIIVRRRNLLLARLSDAPVQVEKWFGAKKELAAVRSVCSHISNMMVGVTHGYEYKMKLVYAHFPINVNCEKIGNSKIKNLIEIRNYLGQKHAWPCPSLTCGYQVTFKVPMQEGCEVDRTKEKDEIVITGNSIEAVGTSVSQIQQICQVKHKDIRKYLDGVYCTTKNVIGQ
eukprot:768749-Hanusia_phi.AAC.16